jgi:large subunit ribosomal protein L5
MSRLKEIYIKEVVPKLQKELGYNNPLAVPCLSKVVLNMGVGKAAQDKKELEEAMMDLRLIAGLQPVETRARASISGFNLRKGVPIGCMVTLRGERMYEFLDKLFNVVLPRTRDFRGLELKGFDGKGNYSLGLSEQVIFPAIDPSEVRKIKGLQVSIVTTASKDKEAELLLRELGCPLKKED